MIWQDLLVAAALVLVWEGLLPALNPNMFRQLMSSISSMDNKKLRVMGLSSMIFGAVLVYLIKQ